VDTRRRRRVVNSSIISRRMMMVVCYYVVSTMLLLSLFELHPANCLPVNADFSQDTRDVKASFAITEQIDRRRSERDKDVHPVKSSSVSVPLLWRIRRSAAGSDESLATARPEKSIRKTGDSNRNSYYNRSGWGGGYGRRR